MPEIKDGRTNGEDTTASWPELGIVVSFEELARGYDELVEQRYDEFLAEGKDDESPVISLSEIPEDKKEARMSALEKKLQEYTERLRSKWIQDVNAFDKLDPDSRFKRDVLGILIKKGSVNTYSISKALAPLGAYSYQELFENACSVIGDYVATGGESNRGGTGL